MTAIEHVYRVLLTGNHVMRTGVIEANLVTLNEEPNATSEQLKGLEKTASDLLSRLDRLIDGYESGLLERNEFENRIGPLRERHKSKQAALTSLRGQASDTVDIDSASAAFA